MGIIISESDMQFGEYSEDQVFCMEHSKQYREKLRPNGVKCCEFVLLQGKRLCFVEAKKSCPNQITAETPNEKRIKYNQYIQDIVEKMKHSLEIYANILLNRYALDEVPIQMRNIKDFDIRLVLVIKNAQIDWLVPFRDKFTKELKNEMRIWKIQNFIVLNEEQARKKNFIL